MSYQFTPNYTNSTILAIESSCDDTSVAIINQGNILANVVASQVVHQQWGGVVPELASREHQKHILPTIHQALSLSKITLPQLDAIAYTQGPGLAGSLLVGANIAKGIAIGINKPLIGVNHLFAHIAALFIDNKEISLPCACLLVSGGHTQIILIQENFKGIVLGSTLDDAAGEAFDKAAKLLNLPYPGGPLVDKLAQQGNPDFVPFPISNLPKYDFSFSGIKTSLLYYLQKNTSSFVQNNLNHICASYQNAIITALINKLQKLINDQTIASIAIAGGVSANTLLRKQILHLAQNNKIAAYIPHFQYCTDNAAMIACAAAMQFQHNQFTPISQPIFTKC